MDLLIQIGVGEAYDRLTILEIKLERIENPKKLKNINREYEYLRGMMTTLIEPKDESRILEKAILRLKEVNEELWDVEDALREYEKEGDFGKEFVALARSVYKLNDERSSLKKTINECHNSYFVEEKSY
jgi:hypothetical protein